jgi:hypothetical protein
LWIKVKKAIRVNGLGEFRSGVPVLVQRTDPVVVQRGQGGGGGLSV